MNNVELKEFIMKELKKEGLDEGLNVNGDQLGDLVVHMTRQQQEHWADGYGTGLIFGGGALLACGLIIKGTKKLLIKK